MLADNLLQLSRPSHPGSIKSSFFTGRFTIITRVPTLNFTHCAVSNLFCVMRQQDFYRHFFGICQQNPEFGLGKRFPSSSIYLGCLCYPRSKHIRRTTATNKAQITLAFIKTNFFLLQLFLIIALLIPPLRFSFAYIKIFGSSLTFIVAIRNRTMVHI